MNKITSLLTLFTIQVSRSFDHLFRLITGFPTLRQSEITPHLYLGGQYNTRGMILMKKIGITAVVNMRTRTIHKDLKQLQFRYLQLATQDHYAPTLDQLKKGVTFIHDEISSGGKVYVHCRYGEGRGPTMAIAYLISTGVLFEDALSEVKKFRTFISPTPSQISQLQKFEKYYRSS